MGAYSEIYPPTSGPAKYPRPIRLSKTPAPYPLDDLHLQRIADIEAASIDPLVNVNSPKCGSKRAETCAKAVGSEEVAGITYYRCISCKYTWREAESEGISFSGWSHDFG